MTESGTGKDFVDRSKSDLWQTRMSGELAPEDLPAAAQALWWDGHGDWHRAHELINELETQDAMAVHAYLHRKEGDNGNADYWYRRAGRRRFNGTLEQEWCALVSELTVP